MTQLIVNDMNVDVTVGGKYYYYNGFKYDNNFSVTTASSTKDTMKASDYLKLIILATERRDTLNRAIEEMTKHFNSFQ